MWWRLWGLSGQGSYGAESGEVARRGLWRTGCYRGLGRGLEGAHARVMRLLAAGRAQRSAKGLIGSSPNLLARASGAVGQGLERRCTSAGSA